MKKSIAFQGTIGANSNLACQKFYPDFLPEAYATFFDVFTAVENGAAEFGMIPFENSSAGRVSEIHNLLQKKSVHIVAEHFVTIEHHLVAVKGSKLKDIKQVYSHPQALMQCRNNLQNLKVELCDFSNTAKAAEFIAKQNDKTKAALCSKVAAEINGLEILQENFQDANDNSTVFIVIAKEMIATDPKISPVIISLIFTIKNYPGSLYKALGSFATNNVSMIQIESFIKGGVRAWGGVSEQAAFFVTIEGHPNQPNIVSALQELEFFAKDIKILGVYYADKLRFEDQDLNKK
ncbi:MAG: prephenate dehydratase domain-containing protein [Rickettsiales bacterium]|nr:prephenate dehydratase domain-containing protein [Rickettsiales bacterium]